MKKDNDPLLNLDGLSGDALEARLDQIVGRAQRRLDKILFEPKYKVLLDFVKDLTMRSCCNVCECISCDALVLLRKIKERS